MRRRAAFGSFVMVVWGAMVVAAQSGVPNASSPDPARRLAQTLAAEARSFLDSRHDLNPMVVVAPVREPSGAYASAAKRVRSALALELAKQSSLRVSVGETVTAPEGAWVLTSSLDVTRETIVLSGRLRTRLGEAASEPELLAALPATDATFAALTLAGASRPRSKVEITSLGDVAGPIFAATAVAAGEGAIDRLAIVGEASTRVLDVAGASVTELASLSHPRGDPSAAPSRSRDPRAGLVALARVGEPATLWVQPPASAPYAWPVGGATAATVHRRGELPFAQRSGGGAWIAAIRDGTNLLASVGSARGPLDGARATPLLDGPFLEVAASGEWLALEEPSGEVALAPASRPAERTPIGPFGSALAVLARPDDDAVWVLGDRDDGATLALVRVASGEPSEAWSAPAPFRVCLLATGRFAASEAFTVMAIGCGERAALAILRIEDAP